MTDLNIQIHVSHVNQFSFVHTSESTECTERVTFQLQRHKAFKQKQYNSIHSHSIAELINILLIQQENFLSYDVNADCIRLKIGQNENGSSDSNLTTSWHCVDFSALSPEDLRDEASLGFLMATNAWHLSGQAPGGCQQLNMCELGYNGAVWGQVSEVMVELAGKVINRWVADDELEERDLESTLR